MGCSSSIDTPPAGGFLIYIQRRNDCCVHFDMRQKPQNLPSVTDPQWAEFNNSVSRASRNMYGMIWEYAPAPFYLVVFLSIVLATRMPRDSFLPAPGFVIYPLMVLLSLITIGVRYYTTAQGQEADKQVSNACSVLAQQTRLTVEYRTENTSFFRCGFGMYAMPTRCVAFSPGATVLTVIGNPGNPIQATVAEQPQP